MIKTESIDFHSYLPPYRSLLTPNARYDYKTHTLVPIKEHDLRALTSMNLRGKQTASSKIKMKYKSLLSDVSKRTSILSLRIGSAANAKQTPIGVKSLPSEVLEYIFELVDSEEAYINCMLVCKQFYQISKPLLYEDLSFTSTYRFAQFITYLRVNPEVGQYIKAVDLSQIKHGEPDDYEDESRELEQTHTSTSHGDNDTINSGTRILAGWRDWKYKNNPLYSIQPCLNLAKVNSNSQALSKSSKTTNSMKMLRLSKTLSYFKPKKRQKLNSAPNKNRAHPHLHTLNLGNRRNNSHPQINKFLMNYSTSKDLPIGYILHLISLCPNIISLNLGNLSLSTDYEISRSMMYKFRTFDLIDNYPKDTAATINGIMNHNNKSIEESLFGFNQDKESFTSLSILNVNDAKSQQMQQPRQNPTSSASSVYSVAFSKPIVKYNSLLPPLPPAIHDLSYMNKGDGKVYLSDLNLKSINSNYLKRLSENEILHAIAKAHSSSDGPYGNKLKYINLSSMIWLTKTSAQRFLDQIVNKCLWEESYFSDAETVNSDSDSEIIGQDLVIDLRDSGMYKNLEWAKLIDLNQAEGRRLIKRIINDDVLNTFDEFMRRERTRRGRIGENYLN
ncbi:unnamed protein product [Debaryomyces tyrocola]|nr:unnamed protein product [Debaryomyces tyrocola]